MTHYSEPRLCTARSRGRPAVLAPHQRVDLLQPALLPPDGCQIAVCWACATHGLLQPSRRHGRIALLTTLALVDSPSLGSAPCSCFGPSAPSIDRLTPRSAAFPVSSRMKGRALKQSNAMVISPSCPPPQDVPPSASGTVSGTARQPSFSATESGDTPRRWGQGGVQQGEETGSASRVTSALTTAAGTERTSRPVQIHSWLE